MGKLTTGQVKIRNTGIILALAGSTWLITSFTLLTKYHFGVANISAIFVIIMALFLLKAGYVAARRVAFLMGAALTMNFLLALSSLGVIIFQLNYEQLKLYLGYDKSFLATNLYYICIIALELWAYIRLTSPTVRSEMKEAHIPYQPFWRYGTTRGALLIILFMLTPALSFVANSAYLKTPLHHADTKIKKEFGSSAFYLIKGIKLEKNPEFIKVYLIILVYDGHSFQLIGIHTKEINKAHDLGESKMTFYFD